MFAVAKCCTSMSSIVSKLVCCTIFTRQVPEIYTVMSN
jgi:hypothetical protein